MYFGKDPLMLVNKGKGKVSQNGHTYNNNSAAFAAELLLYV